MAHISTISGSLRAGSYNRMLAHWAGELLRRQGHTVTDIDLRAHKMPLFDEDLESAEGIPQPVQDVHTILCESDALLMVTPEYNGSVSAALKNAIDWVTRPVGEHAALVAIADKPILLGSASPGGLGGIRVLMHLHVVMGGLGMHVYPKFLSVAKAHEVFDQTGQSREGTLDRQSACVLGYSDTLARIIDGKQATPSMP
jgi:chromate reductase, NAD(P)H dehydrogenase (quinone)